MSEVKFTNGPWRWDADRLVSEDEWVLSPEYDSHSGWAYIDACDEDKNLIAAAPELYSALSSLLSRTSNDADAKHWWPDAQKVAKEALAKARGEHE